MTAVVVVYVDGCPKWTISSLQGAMDLAKTYLADGHSVELVARGAEELRTWHFDHVSGVWREHRI